MPRGAARGEIPAGLILISALYPNIPDPGNQEAQASSAP